jgi:transposase-like protein
VLRKLGGATVRATAEALGLPSTTVRDWMSRYHERAPSLGRGLMAWAVSQGEEVGCLHADEDWQAVAALGAAWHAWSRRGQSRPTGPWRLWGLAITFVRGVETAHGYDAPPFGLGMSSSAT